jgi:hypothetical protein
MLGGWCLVLAPRKVSSQSGWSLVVPAHRAELHVEAVVHVAPVASTDAVLLQTPVQVPADALACSRSHEVVLVAADALLEHGSPQTVGVEVSWLCALGEVVRGVATVAHDALVGSRDVLEDAASDGALGLAVRGGGGGVESESPLASRALAGAVDDLAVGRSWTRALAIGERGSVASVARGLAEVGSAVGAA